MTIRLGNGIVYESPDGGKTVYSRHSHSVERTILSCSPLPIDREKLEKWKLILELAETDETLNSYVKQVETVYELIRKRY